MLQSGMAAIRETLDSVSSTVAGYDASGGSTTRRDTPFLLDQQA